MSGVVEVRGVIAGARERLATGGPKTVLFLDEIHRFNKAQQDALLPQVEDGTITLIGATTENPYFEVNSALLSPTPRLAPRAADRRAGRRARPTRDRGRGARPRRRRSGPTGGVDLAAATPSTISSASPPATRVRPSTCSKAPSPSPTPRAIATSTGRVEPTLEDVESAAQQRVLAYDRAGDGHYDTVSAFIKSIRGNDPDARALLARVA